MSCGFVRIMCYHVHHIIIIVICIYYSVADATFDIKIISQLFKHQLCVSMYLPETYIKVINTSQLIVFLA